MFRTTQGSLHFFPAHWTRAFDETLLAIYSDAIWICAAQQLRSEILTL